MVNWYRLECRHCNSHITTQLHPRLDSDLRGDEMKPLFQFHFGGRVGMTRIPSVSAGSLNGVGYCRRQLGRLLKIYSFLLAKGGLA
jgi:hypothetical protein